MVTGLATRLRGLWPLDPGSAASSIGIGPGAEVATRVLEPRRGAAVRRAGRRRPWDRARSTRSCSAPRDRPRSGAAPTPSSSPSIREAAIRSFGSSSRRGPTAVSTDPAPECLALGLSGAGLRCADSPTACRSRLAVAAGPARCRQLSPSIRCWRPWWSTACLAHVARWSATGTSLAGALRTSGVLAPGRASRSRRPSSSTPPSAPGSAGPLAALTVNGGSWACVLVERTPGCRKRADVRRGTIGLARRLIITNQETCSCHV